MIYTPNRRLVCLLLFTSIAAASGHCEETTKATVCQLKNDPRAFNHKLVEVSGFVSHGFEDFTLFDPTCPSWPEIWLEYGGQATSGTMYCCGVTADRHRPRELIVEGIAVPLNVNEQFSEFDRTIQPPFRSGQYGVQVHAKLIGRFFAGARMNYSKGNQWGGFGHMGCCTLFAIQEVKAVDSTNEPSLDYGASADQPHNEKIGCVYSFLLPIERTSALMQWQQETDAGKRDWAFDDPERVATEILSSIAKTNDISHRTITLMREGQGRKVFEATAGTETYMVVVSRPYWLSFYSRDPKRVAWTATAAYVSSCQDKHSVTRVK